ncbi:hypothetical protein EF888_00875 [Silicimonas algicola]|uniref:LPS-assembly lipoprotein n=1 Tax=Silicimonas algicola TaxID=1826607 RepID=A0A316G2B2_9RHOB|nr:LPS assembly lipoprotein LptE [Silicimonas algicola]AZQ65812.1 hypothetical protein EF888_00875 [Silicimonas algicola]PWK54812.1 LPS-assembly lipoprotein [Silicimonas algicola]
MSSSDRRTLLLSFLALAGCGFTPVYGPGGSAEGLRGRIDVGPPVDEAGYVLVRRLEDRLGASEEGDLALTADIRLSEDAVGFLPDGEISRYNVSGRVEWRLTRKGNDTVVATGSEQSFTSYSATSTTVATAFAARDARRRLMVILADRIVADLMTRVP